MSGNMHYKFNDIPGIYTYVAHTAEDIHSKLARLRTFIQKILASNTGGELTDFATFLIPTSEMS